MLPARYEAISQALLRIDALRQLDRDVLLRVGRLLARVRGWWVPPEQMP